MFGAVLGVHRAYVKIDGRIVTGFFILAWMFRHGELFPIFFYPTFCLFTLWLMSTRVVRAARLPGDFSYGVYVFGWPIQQILVVLFPGLSVPQHIALALLLTVPVAALSWFAVEKPSIEIGRRLASYASSRRRLRAEQATPETLA